MVPLMLALASCTAHMDMTISPSGTYDVTLEMRDTTGTVLSADTDCSSLADPSLVGSSSGTVSAESIGSADDDAGPGCRVTIRGVEVSQSSEATGTAALVTRDGDLYVVDLTGLAASVTWTDTSALTAGVRATGHATTNEGLSWWERHATTLIACVGGAGVLLGVAAVWRWRRSRRGARS